MDEDTLAELSIHNGTESAQATPAKIKVGVEAVEREVAVEAPATRAAVRARNRAKSKKKGGKRIR